VKPRVGSSSLDRVIVFTWDVIFGGPRRGGSEAIFIIGKRNKKM
jgi:hypothetical protein